jgi:hypothetical protein
VTDSIERFPFSCFSFLLTTPTQQGTAIKKSQYKYKYTSLLNDLENIKVELLTVATATIGVLHL